MEDKKPWEKAAEASSKPWEVAVQKKSPVESTSVSPSETSTSESTNPVSQQSQALSENGTNNFVGQSTVKFTASDGGKDVFTPEVGAKLSGKDPFVYLKDKDIEQLHALNKKESAVTTSQYLNQSPNFQQYQKTLVDYNNAVQNNDGQLAAGFNQKLEFLKKQPLNISTGVEKSGVISSLGEEQPFYKGMPEELKNAKTIGDAAALQETLQPVIDQNTAKIEQLQKDKDEVIQPLRQERGFVVDKSGAREYGIASAFLKGATNIVDKTTQTIKLHQMDDAQKIEYLKSKQGQQIAFPEKPANGDAKLAETAGGIAPYFIPGLGLEAAGAEGIAATVGSSIANGLMMGTTAYADGMQRGFDEAMQQGKSEQEALDIAKNIANTNALIGGTTGAVALPLTGALGSKMVGGYEASTLTLPEFLTKTLPKNAISNLPFPMQTYVENKVAQQQGLNRNSMEGVGEQLTAAVFIGSLIDGLHYGGPKLAAKTKEVYQVALAKYGLPETVAAMDAQVKQGNITQQEADNIMQPVLSKAKALESMPDNLTPEQQLIVMPHIEQINTLEGLKAKTAEAFHSTIDAQIEEQNKIVREKLGSPLTEKETKEYEKIVEKRDAPAGEDGKKVKLLDSEKDKLKHFEKRLTKNEANETEKANQAKVLEETEADNLKKTRDATENATTVDLTPETAVEKTPDINQPKTENNAVQERSPEEILSRERSETGATGSIGEGVGQGEQGKETTGESQKEVNGNQEQTSEEILRGQQTETNGEGGKREPPVTGEQEQATAGEGDGTKKTIVTKRAYEGEIREGVKKKLEAIGLTREVESHKEAKEKGKQFIDEVGEDVALDAVRNNDVEGGAAAFIWDEILQNTEKQLAAEKDPAKIQELERRQADLFEEFGKKALSGGRFASALGDIYENSDIQYNLQKKISEYKASNAGEIPADVEARFREYDKQLKEVKVKLVEAQERAKVAEEKTAIDNIKESIKRSKEPKAVYGKTRIAKGLDELASALGAKLSATGTESVKVTKALKEIGRGLVEEGLATSKNVVQKIGEYVREKFGDKIKFEDYEAKLSDEFKEDARLKISHTELRDLVERGIDNIHDLTAALKERYPDATEREIRDAITGYGKTVNPNREEIETQLRKMKRVGRIVSALEDIAEKKHPLKSGKQRDKLDADERALNKELREAMKDLPVDAATEEQQLKTALDATKSRIKNQIEDLQREIDKGEQVPKSTRTVKEDAELKELREKRDALKEEHDKIFKDDAFKEKKRLELAKDRAEKKIEDLQRRIKEGDFSKKVTKPVIADTELIKLNAEKLRIQEAYDKEFYKNKLQNRTKAEKIKDALWEAWGLTRVLRATGEFSFVGVQGLIQTIAHPKIAAEAMKNALRFMGSEAKADNWIREVKSQEWYPTLKKSKLSLTEPHAEVTASEELFYSGWTNHLWDALGSPLKLKSKAAFDNWKALNPFKAIERASVGYLDTIRVERFLDGKQILEEQGKTFENSPKDYKDMADVINTMTGRASLGAAEQFAPVLTKVFFSPRNWASAVKTATPYGLYHFGKMEPVARKMAIGDFSKFLGLTTSMVALAAAGLNNDDDKETGVEFDPRSVDFMKVKLGKRRVDPWGGRQQQVVMQAKLMADALMRVLPEGTIKGAVKKADGEILPLGLSHKTPSAEGVLSKMAINKLAPSAQIIHRYLSTQLKHDGTRVDEYGKAYSLPQEVKDNLYPIYWKTVSDLIKDDPSALNGLLAFYAFFGGNVDVYDDAKSSTAAEPTPTQRQIKKPFRPLVKTR